MKTKSILKRTVPVLVSAVALSVLYSSFAFAGTNMITSDEVHLGDDISFTAGYYEDDTVIDIPTKEELIERGEITTEDLADNITSVTASYYPDGNNDNEGSSDGHPQTVALSDASDNALNVGVDEKVVMPAGFYKTGTTINNGVKHQNVSPAVILDSTTPSITFPAGYYDEHTVSTASIPDDFDAVYTIRHTHGDYCHPEATYDTTYRNYMTRKDDYEDEEHTYDTEHYEFTYICKACGTKFVYDLKSREANGRSAENDPQKKKQAQAQAWKKFTASSHYKNGYCMKSDICCGKSEGEQQVRDVSMLGNGDEVVSVTIDFKQ
ncbi:MAG: hypothetical protein K6G10_06725 [Butyrivibrio sp.]|nr:hypothetical protein [Butyrivibrio sp.]